MRRDLAVGQAIGEQCEDLMLLRGESGDHLVLIWPPAQPLEDLGRHGRIEQVLTGGNAPDGDDEIARANLLEHVQRRQP